MSLALMPKLQDLDDPAFDPFEAEAREYGDFVDTYSRIAALRREGDVREGAIFEHFMGHPSETRGDAASYMVFGYELVLQVLTDSVTFSNHAYKHSLGLSFGASLSLMDAPEHKHYRRFFQKAYQPIDVVEWGEKVVAPVIDELLTSFENRGSADLVREFARLYPYNVIHRQLALDEGARQLFHKMAVTQTLYRSNLTRAKEAGHKLGEYLRQLVERRRSSPGKDFVSHVALTQIGGEFLPVEIIVSFFRQLLNAGGDTTYRGTANVLAGLLTHPDQLDAVRKDHSLLPQAVEEGLRWEGPAMVAPRLVTRDIKLGGMLIPKGSIIDAVIGSANRDPARFPEPDRFDIFRERHARPIPFGAGPHLCIGEHLAKVEMTRALGALLRRLPNLRLDPARPLPEFVGFHLRTPRQLDVVFG